MTMTENYKILAKFVKDMSSETPDIDTYLFVKDNISNYTLNIDIKTKTLKDKIYQVETTLGYSDKTQNTKKSFFEMIFVTIIRLDDNLDNKSDLGKLILCDLQNEIYPDLEKSLLNVIHSAGFGEFKINKKIDFLELYNKHSN